MPSLSRMRAALVLLIFIILRIKGLLFTNNHFVRKVITHFHKIDTTARDGSLLNKRGIATRSDAVTLNIKYLETVPLGTRHDDMTCVR